MATYKNSCWRPRDRGYGPENFITDAKPAEYKGYLIYNRIHGEPGRGVWDIVKDGVCVSQAAGPNGARHLVDALLEEAHVEAHV